MPGMVLRLFLHFFVWPRSSVWFDSTVEMSCVPMMTFDCRHHISPSDIDVRWRWVISRRLFGPSGRQRSCWSRRGRRGPCVMRWHLDGVSRSAGLATRRRGLVSPIHVTRCHQDDIAPRCAARDRHNRSGEPSLIFTLPATSRCRGLRGIR